MTPLQFLRTASLTGLLCLGLLAAGVLVGCGEDSTDDEYPSVDLESGGPGERVAVAPGSNPPDGAGMGLTTGEVHRVVEEDRRALLAILRTRLDTESSEPYSADVVRTFDTEMYRDVDTDVDGPGQRITRAKIVDEDGNVLWSDRMLTFFQLLEYLKLVLDQTSDIDFTVDQVYTFMKHQYSNLLEFPVHIPLGLEGASEYVLEVPDADGNFYEAARFGIERLVRQAESPRYDAPIRTLHQTGPPDDRIDVTILGDGYTPAEKQEFFGDARAVVDEFAETTPFREHMDYFNFRSVWTPSNESGAGYDCKGPDDPHCNDDFADTIFRYTFAAKAIVETFNLELPDSGARVAFPLDVAKMFEVAAPTQFDEVIMLSNSDRRSGFGNMKAAVLTAFDDRRDFPDVAVHEFGHSFGVLGDEYYIRTDPCRYLGDRGELPANIAEYAEYDRLKWNHWVDKDTPLPTPPSRRDDVAIGAYPRAYNCDFLYRPTFMCKMRSSTGGPFCAVCNEQLTRRFYSDIDLLRHNHPTIRRKRDGTVQFETGIRDDGSRYAIQWTLGGDEELGSRGVLSLRPEDVPGEWTELKLVVREVTGNVRKEDPRLREEFSWQVRAR